MADFIDNIFRSREATFFQFRKRLFASKMISNKAITVTSKISHCLKQQQCVDDSGCSRKDLEKIGIQLVAFERIVVVIYLNVCDFQLILFLTHLSYFLIGKLLKKCVPPLLSGIVCAFHPAARVRDPSTPSMLLSIYICIVSCGKDENKQKEVGIGPFFKKAIEKCFASLFSPPRMHATKSDH